MASPRRIAKHPSTTRRTERLQGAARPPGPTYFRDKDGNKVPYEGPGKGSGSTVNWKPDFDGRQMDPILRTPAPDAPLPSRRSSSTGRAHGQGRIELRGRATPDASDRGNSTRRKRKIPRRTTSTGASAACRNATIMATCRRGCLRIFVSIIGRRSGHDRRWIAPMQAALALSATAYVSPQAPAVTCRVSLRSTGSRADRRIQRAVGLRRPTRGPPKSARASRRPTSAMTASARSGSIVPRIARGPRRRTRMIVPMRHRHRAGTGIQRRVRNCRYPSRSTQPVLSRQDRRRPSRKIDRPSPSRRDYIGDRRRHHDHQRRLRPGPVEARGFTCNTIGRARYVISASVPVLAPGGRGVRAV